MASYYHAPTDMFCALIRVQGASLLVDHPYYGRVALPANDFKIGRYL